MNPANSILFGRNDRRLRFEPVEGGDNLRVSITNTMSSTTFAVMLSYDDEEKLARFLQSRVSRRQKGDTP